MIDWIRKAGADDDIGAVVITGGSGKAFSAGGDLKEMKHVENQLHSEARMRRFQEMITSILNCPVPVIASVNGLAYGGGFSLAMACDLVVASAGATFCPAFTNVGLVPDGGLAWTLTRIVGRQKAMQLFLLNEKLTARQAERLGLVARVEPDTAAALASAMSIADRLAHGPVLAQKRLKSLVNRALEIDLRGSLELEALIQPQLLCGPESAGLRAAFADHKVAEV
jgi:2-(1,2-epoxy-1,2-dihydrophenyl)acetyl-CoA isomerase